MTRNKLSQPARKAYAAFMFADLRGFTAFTRVYGDEAAYRLVQQFCQLVATQGASNDGREWKREGDQILLAFPTAYQAVRGAIGVMRAIEVYNDGKPEHPVRVGIGVDVGEPVTAGGDFIGTAVNRTARVTALAKTGQILVTEAVHQLASNLPDIVYVDRGRRALPGFEDEQQLYELVWRAVPVFTDGSRVQSLSPAMVFLGHYAPRAASGVALVVGLIALALVPDASGFRRPFPFAEPEMLPVAAAVATTRSIPQLVAQNRPATVFIASKSEAGVRLGTGIIYDGKGLVVTAAHVIQNAERADIYLADGTLLTGEVLGRSDQQDLAVLRLPQTAYPVATFGDSSQAQVGEEVVILGYPVPFTLGTQANATRGMISQAVSGLGRQYLQIQADLNPGDSGGPVLNKAGQVIGIAVGRSETAMGRTIRGIGFAIPSHILKEVLPRLAEVKKEVAQGESFAAALAPANVVARFYRLIQAGELADAHALMSSNHKALLAPTQLAATYTYDGKIGVQVTDAEVFSQSEGTAEVAAAVLLSELVAGKVHVTVYDQRWRLVREGEAWRIDGLVSGAPRVQ